MPEAMVERDRLVGVTDDQALENLASVTSHLKHLLLIRDLRKIAT